MSPRIVPAVTMIDRLCADALARGGRLLYQRLTQSLDGDCFTKLDALLLPREDLRKPGAVAIQHYLLLQRNLVYTAKRGAVNS